MAGGRPKKEIDMAAVEKLALIQCTQEEIAEFLGVSVRTLQRNKEFCRVYKKGIDSGKMSLRRLQWKAAEKGNVVALIWLGKQYLGQSESPQELALKRAELDHRKWYEAEKLEIDKKVADVKLHGPIEEETEDDGFIEALEGKTKEVWEDAEQDEEEA